MCIRTGIPNQRPMLELQQSLSFIPKSTLQLFDMGYDSRLAIWAAIVRTASHPAATRSSPIILERHWKSINHIVDQYNSPQKYRPSAIGQTAGIDFSVKKNTAAAGPARHAANSGADFRG